MGDMEKMSEAIAAYDEFLNEVDGPFKIGHLTFDASRVLRELDPIAYRVGFFDWADAEDIDTDDLEDDADLP